MLKKIAMDVRNEPQYRDVFLADPEVPGVESIKRSEVMYPIALRTRARKQFAAAREIQRRIRLALEEKNMLPGSPLRMPAMSRVGSSPDVLAAAGALQTSTQITADPNTNRPQETNPFLTQN